MDTAIIGLKDLREHTEHYVSRVRKGKSFTVVRRSKPIFKITPVDEWGDEGLWETIVDFRQIKAGGISARALSKALHERHG
mgnify:CR=1 FL=1